MITTKTSNPSITRETTFTHVPPSDNDHSDVLISRGNGDDVLWCTAIDEMLSWKINSDYFEPEDQPSHDILEAAIDFAYDQICEGGPAPASIVPSGNGRIAMEWNEGNSTVVVEFIGLGFANYNVFVGQKLTINEQLTRNPLSRKLELRG